MTKEIKAVPAYEIIDITKENKGFSLTVRAINGGMRAGRSVIHWPSGKQVKLRDVENLPSGAYRVSLKGLKQSLISPGDRLVPADWDGRMGRKAYFYCPVGREESQHRKAISLREGALGSKGIGGDVFFRGYLATVTFSRPLPLIKGAAYRFEGYDDDWILLGRGDVQKSHLAFIEKALSSWKDRENLFREFLALELGLYSFALLPREHDRVELPRCVRGEGVLVRKPAFDRVSKGIMKRASAMGGVKEEAFKDPLEIRVVQILREKGDLERIKGWLLPSERRGERHLSPMARAQWEGLKGGTGRLSPSEVKDKGGLENWQAMARMGLVRYSPDLIMDEAAYGKESERILTHLRRSGKGDLARIREISSLSRRELIALLGWMEEDGLIVNKEDFREAAE